jgi:hypothetical protein
VSVAVPLSDVRGGASPVDADHDDQLEIRARRRLASTHRRIAWPALATTEEEAEAAASDAAEVDATPEQQCVAHEEHGRGGRGRDDSWVERHHGDAH